MPPALPSGALSFIEATRAELPQLLSLMQAYYQDDHLEVARETTRTTLEQFFREPDRGRIWFIYEREAPVGHVALVWGFSFEYGGRVAVIDELYVQPGARGQGLGQAALSFVEQTCKDAGVKALSLEIEPANGGARRLYLRFGFQEVGRRFFLKNL